MTNGYFFIGFVVLFCRFEPRMTSQPVSFVVHKEEYFYFIISFYAYLFVTLHSQMKNGAYVPVISWVNEVDKHNYRA